MPPGKRKVQGKLSGGRPKKTELYQRLEDALAHARGGDFGRVFELEQRDGLLVGAVDALAVAPEATAPFSGVVTWPVQVGSVVFAFLRRLPLRCAAENDAIALDESSPSGGSSGCNDSRSTETQSTCGARSSPMPTPRWACSVGWSWCACAPTERG